MNAFTVSLFGHREVDNLRLLGDKLADVAKKLIESEEYVIFLIGRNGEFDEFAASVIKSVQRELGKDNNEISLVLPYSVADIEYYEKYYAGIIIPESLCGVHPKSAITLRNRWMVEQSDLVIVHVNHSSCGAYTAKKYAVKLGKRIINLCSDDTIPTFASDVRV